MQSSRQNSMRVSRANSRVELLLFDNNNNNNDMQDFYKVQSPREILAKARSTCSKRDKSQHRWDNSMAAIMVSSTAMTI
jgi:hypothetical protein